MLEVQRKRLKKESPQDREMISLGESEDVNQDRVSCMTYPKTFIITQTYVFDTKLPDLSEQLVLC